MPPASPARLEILDQLVDGPDERVGSLENVLRTQRGPAFCELVGRLAAIVRHDDALHEGVELEPLESTARDVAHELHPLVDRAHRPTRNIRLQSTPSEADPGQADDVGLPCGEGQ